jgi:uncharacterized membrane protein YfcA
MSLVMLSLAAVCLIIFVAAAVQAITGFGYALLAVPLLTVVVDPPTAVVGAGLAGLLLSVVVIAREQMHVRWRPALTLIGTGVVGLPIGLMLLAFLSDRALRLLIAFVVLACTVQVWRSVRLPEHPAVVAGAGFVSGVLSTSTGTNGPPLVAAFQAMGYEPRHFRATLAAVFAGSGVLSIASFTVAGQVTRPVLLLALVGTPAAALGWFAGNTLFVRIDGSRFRHAVLAGLIVSSLISVIRALRG